MPKTVTWLWPHATKTFHFLRESEIETDLPKQYSNDRHILPGVPGTTVIAFESDGKKVYRWFWVMSHIDGCEECPLNRETLPDYWLVDPKSIRPDEESQPWRALAVPALKPPPLQEYPTQFALRWGVWRQKYRPRVQYPRWRVTRWFDATWTKIRAKWRRTVTAITAPNKGRRFLEACKQFLQSETR